MLRSVVTAQFRPWSAAYPLGVKHLNIACNTTSQAASQFSPGSYTFEVRGWCAATSYAATCLGIHMHACVVTPYP